MPIKNVLRMGHPLLQKKAEKISKFDTPELRKLIANMHETMLAHEGAGIAAPQIGMSQQVVMFGFEYNPRYPEAAPIPLTILINPQIEPLGETREEDWEGCLSVPGLRGLVPRYRHIHYKAFDLMGNLIERTVEGFHARVVQHECDHLQGTLYPQRIEQSDKFGFIEELTEAGELTYLV